MIKIKDSIDEFYKLLKLDRKNSQFSQRETFESRCSHLVNETSELKQAIDNQDINNIREEIGDALWNILCMLVIAEEKNHFSAKEVIEESIAKLKRRKPWIYDENNGLPPEEELRIWKKVKNKEKQEKS